MKVCPRCQAKLETPLACSACGVLVSQDSGVPENPFEIFGLDVAYALDAQDLKRRLLRFTRLVHPDYFATAGDEERARAELATASLNAAHEILINDSARADWIVRHLGGPDEQTERSMPQAFLMEVLDWNETLDAARNASAASPERVAVEKLAAELGMRRGQLFRTIAAQLAPLPAPDPAALVEVRKLLNAARYVDKTLGEIAAMRVTQSLSR